MIFLFSVIKQMGCDYYVITKLSVIYTNDKNEEDIMEIEIDRERAYVSSMETDMKTYRELYEEEKSGRESNVCVYEHQKWTIQNQNRINDYCVWLKENNIDIKTVQSIYRRIFCQDR